MLASSLLNENEIIQSVVAGDEKAFRQLFDHYWQNIYAVAFSLTKSSVLAEEIVQDVFLKIWLKRSQLAGISHFKGYLFTVAKNHIYNELRKKTFERPFADYLEQLVVDTSALPEQSILLSETRQLVYKALEQLPRQQRMVFELSRNSDLDHNKIAEKLGISKLTVKSHMTKALQAIRQYIQAHSHSLLLIECLALFFSFNATHF